eukprot:5346187-Heterocapsa_arctica.AAC.1
MKQTFRPREVLKSMATRPLRSMTSSNKVALAKNVQNHMLKNYHIYITHPFVRKDALDNTNIKRTPTGTKRRQIIRPEQMGHEVLICGDYEYCLGCGRTTKTKLSTSAKR